LKSFSFLTCLLYHFSNSTIFLVSHTSYQSLKMHLNIDDILGDLQGGSLPSTPRTPKATLDMFSAIDTEVDVEVEAEAKLRKLRQTVVVEEDENGLPRIKGSSFSFGSDEDGGAQAGAGVSAGVSVGAGLSDGLSAESEDLTPRKKGFKFGFPKLGGSRSHKASDVGGKIGLNSKIGANTGSPSGKLGINIGFGSKMDM